MKERKWKGRERANILIQLSVLLKNGYSLAAAIELLALSITNAERKQSLQNMIADLRNGKSVHLAFEHLLLPQDIIAYLYFSEQYGDLTNGLKLAGMFYLKREMMKEKMYKLLRYPTFLLWLVTILGFIMVHNLFPQFEQMYASISIDLPLLTIIFFQFIEMSPYILIGFAIIFFFLFLYYWATIRNYSPHRKVNIILKIPYISTIMRMLITYFFALQLGGLLSGGLKVSQALTIFSNQEQLQFFKEEAKILMLALQQGESLENAISVRKHFLPELTKVIRHGQQQSQLDKELLMYSDIIYEQLEEKAKRLMMIVQPALFLLIGTIVLFMFTSILLPMMELINSIQ